MRKIKCERGKTMVYPGHYPRLLVTPVFAHEGDFMWVEKIVCMYDADLDDVEEPEFEFHRDTAHYEKNERLQAENAKLCDENVKLREQCAEMWEAIKTHERVNFATILRFGERLRKLGVIE